MPELKCEPCGYLWHSRKKAGEEPKRCPRCGRWRKGLGSGAGRWDPDWLERVGGWRRSLGPREGSQ